MNHNVISFKLAFSGILYAFRTQLNFKIHTIFSVLVLGLGLALGISYVEWIIMVLTIALVFTAEMINTSIEAMTDLITTEHRQSAKLAKDVSAGMVLTAAISSVIIGLLVFLPKLLYLAAI